MTSYDLRISYWKSDLCSSDLPGKDHDLCRPGTRKRARYPGVAVERVAANGAFRHLAGGGALEERDFPHAPCARKAALYRARTGQRSLHADQPAVPARHGASAAQRAARYRAADAARIVRRYPARSEEHTSELQSLMRISYAVFCLKTK